MLKTKLALILCCSIGCIMTNDHTVVASMCNRACFTSCLPECRATGQPYAQCVPYCQDVCGC